MITYIGYDKLERAIETDGRAVNLRLILRNATSALDQVQIIAYGTTTQRLATEDITKISSKEIEEQPVSNVLAALEGRVPGLLITQNTGVPGSAFKIQLNGQSSIGQSGQFPADDPLFIIDGVPYAPNNSIQNNVPSAVGTGGFSPLNGIDPSNIESVEVLKDAAATAIYGSRGANGVILITTKKGKAGKTSVNANVYSGISHISDFVNLSNTQQYEAMRREALTNDGKAINATTAPDLFLLDQNRYTDFKKLLIGNNAQMTNAEVSVNGGNENTQFLLSGGYHFENTVFPTGQRRQKRLFPP